MNSTMKKKIDFLTMKMNELTNNCEPFELKELLIKFSYSEL